MHVNTDTNYKKELFIYEKEKQILLILTIILAVIITAQSPPVFANSRKVDEKKVFDLNGDIGYLHTIGEKTVISYFDPGTGKVSHFTLDGEEYGFSSYVINEDDFWNIVEVNVTVIGNIQKRKAHSYSAIYDKMIGVYIDSHGNRIDTQYDTELDFERYLAKHNLQTLASWKEKQYYTPPYTMDDVKALEPYVYVRDGRFYLNTDRAIEDGVDKELLNLQQEFFDFLNAEAAKNNIEINDDLTIESHADTGVLTRSHYSHCKGGYTSPPYHYWHGFGRYTCDCYTQEIARNFSNTGSVAQGVTLLTFFYAPVSIPSGLTALWFNSVGNEMNYQNKGRGVYSEFNFILFYFISSQ